MLRRFLIHNRRGLRLHQPQPFAQPSSSSSSSSIPSCFSPFLSRGFAVSAPKDDKELAEILQTANEKDLLVIDWTATWCGPCRQIAPLYEELSEKYIEVKFLKCDVDVLRNSAGQAGISAVPSFHFVKGGAKVDEVTGADINKITELVEKHK
mmetsp:Transcript_13781/g.33673  ORF Transcript_13781/g.33673 Transcript_13781/m.33673 type:complete len:152 (-) Transcript_13781:183-638(-)|eukprot:CAMPEP_0114508746 /NCGR_PEP_ID=MMETSP0109-20121206/12800_1 /TAXON_ID=29199 /ORGANISM="Chlorarachnion reptans, Strain CCCM449" /LENGTH=151 /DNA_ID=CAMNT_0001687771 /DNA_START=104 /DNA_END=559 /DNA_ORIENTATION=+